jgi:hypothetical protein
MQRCQINTFVTHYANIGVTLSLFASQLGLKIHFVPDHKTHGRTTFNPYCFRDDYWYIGEVFRMNKILPIAMYISMFSDKISAMESDEES